jgi:hypothetical protein
MDQGSAPEQLVDSPANEAELARILLEFKAICVRGSHVGFEVTGRVQDGTIQRGVRFKIDKPIQ